MKVVEQILYVALFIVLHTYMFVDIKDILYCRVALFSGRACVTKIRV